ncbi:MAG: hypothetical protein LBV67_06615 [Streptococcaceae bacterium]|jgi:hypothetical protein|nr:hypothetical protein [Streptococcaceae bacterium]
MANTIQSIPLKQNAFGKTVSLAENKLARLQGNAGKEIPKYVATSENVSDLEIYVQNPRKAQPSTLNDLLQLSNAKLVLTNVRGNGREAISFVRTTLLADKVDVVGTWNLADYKPNENTILDIKSNAREKLEWISKNADIEKLFGDLRFVSAVAKEEFFDGQRTGELEGYEVTVVSEAQSDSFTFLIEDLNTDFKQFRPLVDVVEFDDLVITSLFADVSTVESGGVNIGLKARTLHKKNAQVAPKSAPQPKNEEKK